MFDTLAFGARANFRLLCIGILELVPADSNFFREMFCYQIDEFVIVIFRVVPSR